MIKNDQKPKFVANKMTQKTCSNMLHSDEVLGYRRLDEIILRYVQQAFSFSIRTHFSRPGSSERTWEIEELELDQKAYS